MAALVKGAHAFTLGSGGGVEGVRCNRRSTATAAHPPLCSSSSLEGSAISNCARGVSSQSSGPFVQSQNRRLSIHVQQAGADKVVLSTKASRLSARPATLPTASCHSFPAAVGSCRPSLAAHYAVDDGAIEGREEGSSVEGRISTELRETDAAAASTEQLERSFIMDAVVGRVVCNSKGCRPIFPSAPLCTSLPDTCTGRASCFQGYTQGSEAQKAGYRSKVSQWEADGHSCALPQFPMEFAQFVDQMWLETATAEKYYEAAVQQAPYNVRLLTRYAEFSWRQLQNAERAEALYKRALEESPESAEVLASYALFLWQGE